MNQHLLSVSKYPHIITLLYKNASYVGVITEFCRVNGRLKWSMTKEEALKVNKEFLLGVLPSSKSFLKN